MVFPTWRGPDMTCMNRLGCSGLHWPPRPRFTGRSPCAPGAAPVSARSTPETYCSDGTRVHWRSNCNGVMKTCSSTVYGLVRKRGGRFRFLVVYGQPDHGVMGPIHELNRIVKRLSNHRFSQPHLRRPANLEPEPVDKRQ